MEAILYDRVNEEVVYYLKHERGANKIVMDYIDIVNPFKDFLLKLESLNKFYDVNNDENYEDTITKIRFISLKEKVENNIADLELYNARLLAIKLLVNYTGGINELDNSYRYCANFKSAYVEVKASVSNSVFEIDKWIEQNQLYINKYQTLIALKDSSVFENYRDEFVILSEAFKKNLYKLNTSYRLWCKCFSLNKAYDVCLKDKSIFAFTHRLRGFSNPKYWLTDNFSVEIKSNFGYGRSSYFVILITYKNLMITPFSEWVEYENANITEIISYSKSFELKNDQWLSALTYCRDACNVSLIDERQFVSTYIIGECEKMVIGLEQMLEEEYSGFSDKYSVQNCLKTITGHSKIAFIGEKISGSLDFIQRILDFEYVAEVKELVDRIYNCNKKVLIILNNQILAIQFELNVLHIEEKELNIIYVDFVSKQEVFNERVNLYYKNMILSGEIQDNNSEYDKCQIKFKNSNPDYDFFSKKYCKHNNMRNKVLFDIGLLTPKYERMRLYSKKIQDYLEVEKSFVV